MSDKKRCTLNSLSLLIMIILFNSNTKIHNRLNSIVFAHITWEQLVLGLLIFSIAYILLFDGNLSKKDKN